MFGCRTNFVAVSESFDKIDAAKVNLWVKQSYVLATAILDLFLAAVTLVFQRTVSAYDSIPIKYRL